MKTILLPIFLLLSYAAISQGTVKGIVIDTANKKSLPSATISVLDANDSSLVSFARTNEQGMFNVKNLGNGHYVLMVSYTGFGTKSKKFTISAAEPDADLSVLPMTSVSSLQDVVVTAAPVIIKGDTTEFNASSFKTKPNAAVEDLLKKLPGVTVDKDGTIKSNGQTITKILVDGKQFFGNDPKLATKNLQADVVNKVQVFDKKSDKSEFTGFDDGNSEPTINLTLKADKRVGIFGKISAGGGTDGRYEGSGNLNSFKKGQQLSFIGQANNTNVQGFSLQDALSFSNGGGGGGGGFNIGGGANIQGFGGNGQGITKTATFGTNYNNFVSSKADFASSYFYNGTQLNNSYNTRRQYLNTDTSQVYTEPGNSSRINDNHRINMSLDWKLDSFNSIKISPSFTYQTTESESDKTYQTVSNKSLAPISSGFSNTYSNGSGYNLNTTALFRHRFERKGRTFSVQGTWGKNESNSTGGQFTQNLSNYGIFNKIDTLDQQNNAKKIAENYSVNISYTEPLSKRSLLELNTYYNHSDNSNDKHTFNKNAISKNYDIPNANLTNNFNNDYDYTGFGVNYRENRKTWNYTLGAKIQQSTLKSLLQNKTAPISQSFTNVLPTAMFQFKPNNFENLRLNYSGSTSQPSVSQLQPIYDSTDVLNVTLGNPNLKQTFTNSLRLNYNIFDPYTHKSFFVFINGSASNNKIVNNDSTFAFGHRLTTYQNVSGVYNLNSNASIGVPLKLGKELANVNFGFSLGYNHNKALLSGNENIINSLNAGQNTSISYINSLFDISLGSNISWNNVKYSLQAANNTNYFTQNYSLDNSWFIPGGLTYANEFDYTINSGRTAAYNTKVALWNMSLAKTVLKSKKGEIKLSVHDLLNQNVGVTRNTNSNYVEDQTYLVLKRYVMLSFTLNLSQFGDMKGMRQMMRMGGGGGRF